MYRVEPEAKKQILDFYKQDPENAKKQFGDEPFELKNILKYWVRSKNPDMHFIPTDTLYVTIDKEAVKKSGMMMASDSIPDKMVISLAGKSALYKGDLMMLEMLAQCNWTRPLYVALTVGEENYMNLGDNFVQEGLVEPYHSVHHQQARCQELRYREGLSQHHDPIQVRQPEAEGSLYRRDNHAHVLYTPSPARPDSPPAHRRRQEAEGYQHPEEG